MTPPTHSLWVYLGLRAGVFYLSFQSNMQTSLPGNSMIADPAVSCAVTH